MTLTSSTSRSDRWESLRIGYVRAENGAVDGVPLHQLFDEDVDPVTYEVIRSKLWNANMDHMETIRRTSGSLVVVLGWDFNCSIQTEVGEGVVFGPGNLFFAGCADSVIGWTLAHRSENPGISEGDVFIQDDPWVGANHAMDTAVYRPVFVDGKLFAWVYNVAHERELGGAEPGGFVQSASDVFTESTFWPPVKLVERGILRQDLLEAWVRRSRMPSLMVVEVKAQIAGVNMAHDRLKASVERYGASVIKGVMRKMISNTAKTVGRRLREIPDGVWHETRYVAGASPSDHRMYRLSMSMTKKDDRLCIDNHGTDRSIGSFNLTAPMFRACVVSPLLLFLAYDQYLCGGGLLAQLDFEFAEDAINSAHHPAAISTSLGLSMTLIQAQFVAAKMLSSHPSTRRHVIAASGVHTATQNMVYGTDQFERPFAVFPWDGTTGAIGAFSFRDGFDHGGNIFAPIGPLGSVEGYERETPFLYLYRKEVSDSGGHGQWRGGATLVSAWTGHKSDDVFISSAGLLSSVTGGAGLLGGFPSTGGRMWHALDTDLVAAATAGRFPDGPDSLRELAPWGGPPPPKKFDNRLRPGDVFEVMPQPGAGYGDPILREPDLVASDVRLGRCSSMDADRIYGVVLSGEGVLDIPGTNALRTARREERLRVAIAAPKERNGIAVVGSTHVLATVCFGHLDGEPVIACAFCGAALAGSGESPRLGCRQIEWLLPEISPHFTDPRDQVGEELCYRAYICPQCGTALDGEVCRPSDPPSLDVRMVPEAAAITGIDAVNA
jgi:N-methylhydantoinase B